MSLLICPEQSVPLVFVFHGGGSAAADTMGLSRFNALADREKCIVVYPQGIGRSWNDGHLPCRPV